MATPNFSALLPGMALQELNELSKTLGVNRTQIVIRAIHELHKQEIKTMTSKYDYSVIEDNGGGLHLFLFRPGTEEIAMGFTGFEGAPGSLVTSLDSLDSGDSARSWDGKMDDAQEQWDFFQSHDYSHQVIVYGENGERTLKPDRMGRAGQIEFGVATAGGEHSTADPFRLAVSGPQLAPL